MDGVGGTGKRKDKVRKTKKDKGKGDERKSKRTHWVVLGTSEIRENPIYRH